MAIRRVKAKFKKIPSFNSTVNSIIPPIRLHAWFYRNFVVKNFDLKKTQVVQMYFRYWNSITPNCSLYYYNLPTAADSAQTLHIFQFPIKIELLKFQCLASLIYIAKYPIHNLVNFSIPLQSFCSVFKSLFEPVWGREDCLCSPKCNYDMKLNNLGIGPLFPVSNKRIWFEGRVFPVRRKLFAGVKTTSSILTRYLIPTILFSKFNTIHFEVIIYKRT